MNTKVLQYIMGHSDITMTLNYYAHATSDSTVAEMERLIVKVVNRDFTTFLTTYEKENTRGNENI